MKQQLTFSSDYMEGMHPAILERMIATNFEKTAGYGTDEYSEQARAKIRAACCCPEAEIHFLVGGTQTNVTVIDALLASYQGVLAPTTGHITVHEAGAIEYGGHKVLSLPAKLGKISASQIETAILEYERDENCDHLVMPGMVYISQPTEHGTLYSKEELTQISRVCRAHHIPLYVDGARLAYALACKKNDVTLADLAELCDVFYIGGTKCGALIGEAVVIPKPGLIPHFFSIIKQHGALLAKGRILGLQFDTLFTDGLYERIGAEAVSYADEIRSAFRLNGYSLCFDSPTNQVFVVLTNEQAEKLSRKVEYGFWEKPDDTHTVIRLAADWATTKEDVDALLDILNHPL